MKTVPFVTEEVEPVLPLDFEEEKLRQVIADWSKTAPRLAFTAGIIRLLQHLHPGEDSISHMVCKHLECLVVAAETVSALLEKRSCQQAVRFRNCAHTITRILSLLDTPHPEVTVNDWAIAVADVAHTVMASYAPLEDWVVAFPLAATLRAGYQLVHCAFPQFDEPIALSDAVAHLVAPGVETRCIEKRYEEAGKPINRFRLAKQLRCFYRWELTLLQSADRPGMKHPLASRKEVLESDIVLSTEDSPTTLEIAPSREPDPLEQILQQEAAQSLLDAATGKTHHLLELMLQGYDIHEAAKVIGITPQSARVLLHKFRRKISKRFGNG